MAEIKGGVHHSYECMEMIADVKQDIIEFGDDCEVYAVKRKGKHGTAWYIDYYYELNNLVEDQAGLNGDTLVKTTLGELLPALIKQNDII